MIGNTNVRPLIERYTGEIYTNNLLNASSNNTKIVVNYSTIGGGVSRLR